MSKKADCMRLHYLGNPFNVHRITMIQTGSGHPPSWLFLLDLLPLRIDLHKLLSLLSLLALVSSTIRSAPKSNQNET